MYRIAHRSIVTVFVGHVSFSDDKKAELLMIVSRMNKEYKNTIVHWLEAKSNYAPRRFKRKNKRKHVC